MTSDYINGEELVLLVLQALLETMVFPQNMKSVIEP